jgi:S1-C subfamily serine protease
MGIDLAGRWLAGIGAELVTLAVAACSSTVGSGTSSVNRGPAATAPAAAAASSLEQQYEQVVSRVLPSVVEISTGSGSGSGVIYDSKGDIVTNAHVVGTATTVQVGLASTGKPLAAHVTGVFAPDDLAVIKLDTGAGVASRAIRPVGVGAGRGDRAGHG